MKKLTFISRNEAKKQTGLSYLGTYNISAKLVKNVKLNQLTYSIYLAPYNLSGFNVCEHASPECIAACLHRSGHVKLEKLSGTDKIEQARIKKTKLFFENNEFFMDWLVADIKHFQNVAKRKNMFFSARLNCTSDINFSNYPVNGKTIYEIFPDVQFYDYTKNWRKFENKPDNYHLTFSYSGANMSICKKLLSAGHNIAVVFNVGKNKPLPAKYIDFKVIDGDITDYRPADEKNVIVGLRYKQTSNKINFAASKFVVSI